jgi:hypothetical protein
VRARWHATRERLARFGLVDGAGPLGRVPAAATVDIHSVVAVQADLEQPVGRQWPALLALPLLGLPSLLVGDPLVDDGELPGGVLFDDATGEAERVEPGHLVVHLLLLSRVSALAQKIEQML